MEGEAGRGGKGGGSGWEDWEEEGQGGGRVVPGHGEEGGGVVGGWA